MINFGRSMTVLAASVAAFTMSGVAIAQTATSASNYVAKAGAGDQYEIQSSKLLLTSTHDPKLKKFASKMIADHTKSTAMVKAAATKAGMNPPLPALDADGQQMLSDLQSATGKDRDMKYVSQQKMAHDKALALHQDYSQNGDSPPLKMAAAKIVPVVQSHETMLGGMSGM